MECKSLRNLLIFSVVSLASGWLGWWLDRSMANPVDEETPGMGLWLVLPLLTVLFLRLFLGEGWHNLKIRPLFRQNIAWYLLSLFAFPTVTLLMVLLGKVCGWTDTSGFSTSLYLGVLGSSLLPNFIKNIFEESVWRGYLADKLIQLEIKDRWIYLIVGGIWGFWHWPYYMYFLPESMLEQILPVNKITFAFVAVASMTCWSVLFVELFRITASLWPVIILHAVEDSVVNHLILDGHIHISEGKEILISPICGIITSLLYLAIGLWLRRKRLQPQV